MQFSDPQSPARQLATVAWRYRYPRSGVARQITWMRGRSVSGPDLQAADAGAAPAGPRDDRLKRLESILLLAREPLSSRKLSDYANLADGTEARTLIRRLNNLYDESGRAFRVEEVAGGFQLLSRPKFAAWLRRLAHVPAETRLSAPVLETLAVIAYRQPVLRADIEAVRGVNCGEILRQLMERDLVCISGRSQELGRPYLYSTTKRFLQLFGLPNLDKLPRVEIMRAISDTANPAAPSANAVDGNGPQDHTHSKPLFPQKEESEVTVTTRELPQEECLVGPALLSAIAIAAQAKKDEDEDEEFEEEDDLDEDEDEEFDDEEEDEEDEFEDEEFDDEFEEEDEDFEDEEDEDFDDEEWEEVDDEEEDEEEDEDWDEDEEMDWGDDDDDEDDEEEEEEEEDWE